MSGWQPIETAPDDVDILVFEKGYPVIVTCRFRNERGEREWLHIGQWTHWAPIPEEPKT